MKTSKYKPTLFDAICAEIAFSSSPLAVICAKHKVSPGSFFKWMRSDRDESLGLRDAYTLARQMQADYLADEILLIADTPSIGKTVKEKANGTEITCGDMLGHRRLQIETRKWKAALLAPKKYGAQAVYKAAEEPVDEEIIIGP